MNLCFKAALNRVLGVRGQCWINGGVWLGQRWKVRKVSSTPAAKSVLDESATLLLVIIRIFHSCLLMPGPSSLIVSHQIKFLSDQERV